MRKKKQYKIVGSKRLARAMVSKMIKYRERIVTKKMSRAEERHIKILEQLFK